MDFGFFNFLCLVLVDMCVHWHDFPIGNFPATSTPSSTFVTLWQLFDSIWLFAVRQPNKPTNNQQATEKWTDRWTKWQRVVLTEAGGRQRASVVSRGYLSIEDRNEKCDRSRRLRKSALHEARWGAGTLIL